MTDPTGNHDAEKPDVSAQFTRVIENYWASIRAYREFLFAVDAVVAELATREPDHLNTVLARVQRDLPGADLRRIAAALRKLGSLADSAAASGNQGADGEADAFSLEGETAAAFVRIVKGLTRSIPHTRHQELLYQGVLTGLVGQFEVLLADVAHLYFGKAPGALENDDKVYSIAELMQFASIDEAVDYQLEKRIDDLLRGSVEDWRKFFALRVKLDLSELAQDWSRFVEYIQRRHIIVHAGGRISRRYLSNVDPELVAEYFGQARIGDAATLDADYVATALESFESTGLMFAFGVWSKLYPNEAPFVASLLLDIVYEIILAGNWRTVAALAGWGAQNDLFDAAQRFTCQLNAWQAERRLGKWDEIESAVRNFDVTALHPRFAAVRAGLLGDFDQFRYIVEANEGAGLNRDAWEEWPILEWVRSHADYPDLQSRYATVDAEYTPGDEGAETDNDSTSDA